jgi:hypothetical protein
MRNKTSSPRLYGLLAKFETHEDLVDAADKVYQAGYRKFDAYSPYPIEELSHAMRLKPSPLPYLVFLGGLAGAVLGFGMQWYGQVIDYPQNIGGRPAFSWPLYIPITFETTVLFAALAGVLGLFLFLRFPQPYHPVFRSDDFNQHASRDGFYLTVEAADLHFHTADTRKLLEDAGSVQVTELEA